MNIPETYNAKSDLIGILFLYEYTKFNYISECFHCRSSPLALRGQHSTTKQRMGLSVVPIAICMRTST